MHSSQSNSAHQIILPSPDLPMHRPINNWLYKTKVLGPLKYKFLEDDLYQKEKNFSHLSKSI